MIKYIHGFPSSYVLENVLAMSEEEVLYWLKEYHHFNKGTYINFYYRKKKSSST